MARIWPGIGINYGHHISGVTYDSSQTTADLAYLYSVGIRRIRVAMPLYNASTALMDNTKDAVTQALAAGHYVSWGVSMMSPITATNWATFKTYVADTLRPWAQSVGLSELILGNELEGKADETTITAATIRTDINSLAATVKSGGFAGKVSYCSETNHSNVANWRTTGIGASLDYLFFNSYDILPNFSNIAKDISRSFPLNKTGITEWGSKSGGYPDFNNEYDFYADTAQRLSILKDNKIQVGYFFTYRDGAYSLSPDTYAVKLTSGGMRKAFDILVGNIGDTRRQKLNKPYSIALSSTVPITVTASDSINFVATNTYSWAFRFKISRNPAVAVSCVLANKAVGGASGYQIYIGDNCIYFQERKTYTKWASEVIHDMPIGKWCDLVVTYDGTGQDIQFYLDGRRVYSVPGSFSWANVVDNTATNLSIGLASIGENLNGNICDCGLYNRILTRDEIEAFRHGLAPSSPNLFLPCDDNYGTAIRDTSGNGNTAAIAVSTRWDKGPDVPSIMNRNIGKSLSFDGYSSYATLPITPGADGFSFAFWLYFPVLQAGFGRIFDYYDGSGNGTRMLLNTPANRILTFDARTTGAGGASSGNGQIREGKWMHITLTNQGANLAMYINGVLRAKSTGSTFTAPTGQTFTLGRTSNAAGTYGKFLIADFIYKPGDIFTNQEILDHMTLGKVPAGVTCHHQFDDSVTDLTGNDNNLTLSNTAYSSNVPIRQK